MLKRRLDGKPKMIEANCTHNSNKAGNSDVTQLDVKEQPSLLSQKQGSNSVET
jgi:hypothetical protein